jgi:hypothetical protein
MPLAKRMKFDFGSLKSSLASSIGLNALAKVPERHSLTVSRPLVLSALTRIAHSQRDSLCRSVKDEINTFPLALSQKLEGEG